MDPRQPGVEEDPANLFIEPAAFDVHSLVITDPFQDWLASDPLPAPKLATHSIFDWQLSCSVTPKKRTLALEKPDEVEKRLKSSSAASPLSTLNDPRPTTNVAPVKIILNATNAALLKPPQPLTTTSIPLPPQLLPLDINQISPAELATFNNYVDQEIKKLHSPTALTESVYQLLRFNSLYRSNSQTAFNFVINNDEKSWSYLFKDMPDLEVRLKALFDNQPQAKIKLALPECNDLFINDQLAHILTQLIKGREVEMTINSSENLTSALLANLNLLEHAGSLNFFFKDERKTLNFMQRLKSNGTQLINRKLNLHVKVNNESHLKNSYTYLYPVNWLVFSGEIITRSELVTSKWLADLNSSPAAAIQFNIDIPIVQNKDKSKYIGVFLQALENYSLIQKPLILNLKPHEHEGLYLNSHLALMGLLNALQRKTLHQVIAINISNGFSNRFTTDALIDLIFLLNKLDLKPTLIFTIGSKSERQFQRLYSSHEHRELFIRLVKSSVIKLVNENNDPLFWEQLKQLQPYFLSQQPTMEQLAQEFRQRQINAFNVRNSANDPARFFSPAASTGVPAPISIASDNKQHK